MRSHPIGHLAFVCALLASWTPFAWGAGPRVRVMSVDMPSLIDRAADSPTRFAVDVPYVASPETQGEWTTTGSMSTWRHSLQIPGAVSMSFHATPVQMPAGSILKVTIGGLDYVYSANDVRHGELWSRIGRGDAISFELRLPEKDRAALRFDLASVQAGYRAFDSAKRDHPHYKALSLPTEAAATAADCTENWACRITSSNAQQGQATVALVIRNVAQCTGVLLNNVPGDSTPYVLTARHCENGDPNGGNPGAAGSVVVYWNAVTACSDPLGSIYSPGIPAQWGATTVVEQQDVWLIRLNDLPVVDDAYYAGWDATGGTLVGGFTPHHGLGNTRQFTGWFGQAALQNVPGSVLGLGFNSTFWGTVNDVGSIAPGASGSGLFDTNGRLVGTLARGRLQGAAQDGPGVCPSLSPPAPSSLTATALFTTLSGVFSSTEDPKSTTGSVTLQSVLDSARSGKQVLDGQTQPPVVSFATGGASDPLAGSTTTLFWNSRRVQSCTASGGVTGDGWAGARPASGSAQVINFDGGDVEYVLVCTDGNRSATARQTVHWQLQTPTAILSSPGSSAYGTPFQLHWTSNVRPCVASGGLAGDGWTGTLSNFDVSVVETQTGTVSYTLTCGSGTRTATANASITISAPTAQVTSDVTSIRVGERVRIATSTSGKPCTASGGASGDGWATSVIPSGPSSYGEFDITETTPGTYTYVVSCGSGAHVATAQTTVTFTGGPPSVTLVATPTTAQATLLNSGSGDDVTLTWASNVRPCTLSAVSPVTTSLPNIDTSPSGTMIVHSMLTGTITYAATCGSGATSTQATAQVTWTGIPQVSLSAPASVIAGARFQVQYSANVLLPCTATGGSAGDGWSGAVPPSATPPFLPVALGQLPVVETTPGTYTYVVTCGSGADVITAQATTTVLATAPFLNMTITKPQALIGESVTITWSSNTSPCSPAGGSGFDGWTGVLPSSGSITLTETTARSYFYQMRCGVPPLDAVGSVSATFITTPPPMLHASRTAASVGENVTLTWSSSDGATCSAAGGTAGDGWFGDKAASGTFDVREPGTGTYTFYLTCGTAPTASVEVTFSAPPPARALTLPPSVELIASASSVVAGDPVTLTYWMANVDACTASGGNASDGWETRNLSMIGGAQSVRETTAGTYVYAITCTRAGFADVRSSVTVTVTPQVVVSGTPSGGGGGGGGRLGLLDLMCLALLAAGLATLRSCGARRRRIQS